jgi:cobalt-precorrin-5B (C1)-methyltransferase
MPFFISNQGKMDDLYIYHKGRKLRCGYTTGSCATAAAKAAALMLHHQKIIKRVEIETPANVPLSLEVINPVFNTNEASCCIIKDAGDDHDATNGMEICARVQKSNEKEIVIKGGPGIGTITKPGFWGNPGETAINPVPRKMIIKEVLEVADSGWDIVITAPQGEEISRNTLNDKLGITGGISIIGTTGIVEPMSNEALKQTIYLEIDDIARETTRDILLYLGNYGLKTAQDLGLSAPGVKISNFIGDAVLYCRNLQFERVTLIGHIGKLSKLSIGAFNTHSSVCDLRMEAFVYYLALAGAPQNLIKQVASCSDSEEALDLILDQKFGNIVTNMREGCIDRIRGYVKKPDFNVRIYIYSMSKGLLN